MAFLLALGGLYAPSPPHGLPQPDQANGQNSLTKRTVSRRSDRADGSTRARVAGRSVGVMNSDGESLAARAPDGVPWQVRLRTVAMHILVVGSALLVTAMAAGTAQRRLQDGVGDFFTGTLGEVWVGAAIGAALLLPFALILREHTNWVAWGLGIAQLVLPLGPVMAFALPSFLRRASVREGIGAGALHLAGVGAWFAMDAQGTTATNSVLRMLAGGDPTNRDQPIDVPIAAAIALYLFVTVLPVILGLVTHYRQQLEDNRQVLASSQEVLEARGASLGRMEDALSRKAEREAMAREIHDVIGHRLSMINVYAGGLELAAEKDPELAQSARLVREASQQTVEDLRSLVHLMREPGGLAASTARNAESLSNLVWMIEDVVGAGRPLASSVMLDRAEEAPPMLAHTVYRILQELLTNTHKHGADGAVRIRVEGGPARGITIEVSNPVARGAAIPEEGTGLMGVRERAEALGGTVTKTPGPREFVVRVKLPWEEGVPTDDNLKR